MYQNRQGPTRPTAPAEKLSDKRDRIALEAMKALIAQGKDPKTTANMAYDYAVAMLDVRHDFYIRDGEILAERMERKANDIRRGKVGANVGEAIEGAQRQ